MNTELISRDHLCDPLAMPPLPAQPMTDLQLPIPVRKASRVDQRDEDGRRVLVGAPRYAKAKSLVPGPLQDDGTDGGGCPNSPSLTGVIHRA